MQLRGMLCFRATWRMPRTRQELIECDGAVAKLCEEVFGENRWQYQRADDRARFGEAHLKKLDREKAPVFAFSEEEEKAARESGMTK
jgi:hypothetical protein